MAFSASLVSLPSLPRAQGGPNSAEARRLYALPGIVGRDAFLTVTDDHGQSASAIVSVRVVGKDAPLAAGLNDSGQLGTDDFISSTVPISVSATATFDSVAAGAQHSLAVGKDRTVWAWGANYESQLGCLTR